MIKNRIGLAAILVLLLAAPLMAGNDIRSMSPEIAEILTNKEVIAVDQDLARGSAFHR